LLPEIALTMSPSVKRSASSLAGSASTSIAGVTVPFAFTLATPSTCSISGTISFVMTAESCAAFSDGEVTASDAIVAWLGTNGRTFGAERSVGSCERVDCTRRCTSTRSLV